LAISNLAMKPLYALTEFKYDLPPERIAQGALADRSASRLMLLDRAEKSIRHDVFRNILNHLGTEDLLIFNNTQVLSACFFGKKDSGGKLEFLFLKETEPELFSVFIKGKVRQGTPFTISGNGLTATGTVQKLQSNGERLIKVPGFCQADLLKLGTTPLPPYIKRVPGENRPLDRERYQTVYAKEAGAVAAPTAGLHFTNEILDALKKKGIDRSELTLHVGAGTFKPIEQEDYENHIMHSEYYKVPKEMREKLNACKGRKIAVGTTSVRTCETFHRTGEADGWTNLFLYPPAKIETVSGLLTNFHLPESTLLMLVACFCGLDFLLEAYAEAIAENYRFYSYGDAMLII